MIHQLKPPAILFDPFPSIQISRYICTIVHAFKQGQFNLDFIQKMFSHIFKQNCR